MKCQILSMVMLCLITAPLSAQEQKMTPEAFVESLQGTWEIVSRNNGGREWTPKAGSRKPVMTVEKQTMFLPEGIGKLPYEMQNVVINEKTNVATFMLVAKLGQRVMRRPARAKLSDGELTFAIHKYRGQLPESLEPDKNTQIQVWKRQKKPAD